MKPPTLFLVGLIWHFRFQRDGKRVQRTTGETSRVKAEAIAWAARTGETSFQTLAQLAQKWLEVHATTRSASHLRSVATFAHHHLYGLADLPINRIRTEEVETARIRHLEGRTPDTANHWLRILGLLFGWAVRRELLPKIPWTVKPLRVQKKPRVILPIDKGQAWLAAIDQEARGRKELSTAVRMMIGLGLRESEALSSCWEWIDWERKTYTPGITKGREAVPLPMPAWLFEHLEAVRDGKTEGLICRSPRTWSPYSPGSTRALIAAANAACGTPGLTPHRLRGTFATWLSEASLPIQDVQRMLRHKDVKTTMNYLEQDFSRTQRVQAVLGEKFAGWRKGGEVQPGKVRG